jgi:hypothetical protein
MSFGFGMKFQNLLLAKAGYSNIVSSDGTLAPFVTFTRTTTGTRYNSAGLLETMAINAPRFDYDPTTATQVNIQKYSQQFDNAHWVKYDVTIQQNVDVAPDGTLTADKMTESATTAAHIMRPSSLFNGVVSTTSIYAKAAGRRYLNISNSGLDAVRATFDVQEGSVIFSSGVTASIQNAGNGWWRCIVAFTAGQSFPSFSLKPSTAGGGEPIYAGDGSSGIFIWGAQVNYGTSVNTYIQTEASPAGNATLLGLLIEDQRTNSLLWSADIDNAVWSKVNSTITANSLIAPNGTLSADTVSANGGVVSGITQTMPANSGTHTVTMYAKAGTKQFIQFSANANSWGTDARANFDLQNGTLGTVDASLTARIQSVGGGWYRCSVTGTKAATAGVVIWVLIDSSTDAREPVTSAGSVYMWGAQLEAGASATSYIPTTTASMTRAWDDALISSASSIGFNQSEGTVVVENISPFGVLTVASAFSFVGAGANGFNMGAGGTSRWWNGTTNITTANAVTSGARKEAFAFTASGGRSICLNGGTVATDAGVPWQTPSPTGARISANGVAGNQLLNGTIKSLRYYPRRLTDAELQQMTA